MPAPIQPTGPAYLDTPLRRSAQMEHDFYPWRDTHAQAHLHWQDGAGLGIWIQLAVEWFPMNISGQPFLPHGAPYRPWPDSEVYTQRDYGNRVGIYRMLDALEQRAIPVSAFLNARVAQRYPILMQHLLAAGHDIVAAGLDAGAIHHEGLSETEEGAMIAETLAILKGFGVTPSAWHSPGWSQSSRTPALLKAAGLGAMVDWSNDEVPYAFATPQGPIASLPLLPELSDRDAIHQWKHRQGEFESAVLRAARRLLREAADTGTGRLLPINLSPWIMGQPYRAALFERILDGLSALQGASFVTTPQILHATTDLTA